MIDHVLRAQDATGGRAYTLVCTGPAHEVETTLAIFISRAELERMPRNRSVADQLALRADAYHWFVRLAPETVDSFRVEIIRCPACQIMELTEIASAVGDIAVALGLPSETPPATVVAAARALTGDRLDDLSTEDLININTGSARGRRDREWSRNYALDAHVNPHAIHPRQDHDGDGPCAACASESKP